MSDQMIDSFVSAWQLCLITLEQVGELIYWFFNQITLFWLLVLGIALRFGQPYCPDYLRRWASYKAFLFFIAYFIHCFVVVNEGTVSFFQKHRLGEVNPAFIDICFRLPLATLTVHGMAMAFFSLIAIVVSPVLSAKRACGRTRQRLCNWWVRWQKHRAEKRRKKQEVDLPVEPAPQSRMDVIREKIERAKQEHDELVMLIAESPFNQAEQKVFIQNAERKLQQNIARILAG